MTIKVHIRCVEICTILNREKFDEKQMSQFEGGSVFWCYYDSVKCGMCRHKAFVVLNILTSTINVQGNMYRR